MGCALQVDLTRKAQTEAKTPRHWPTTSSALLTPVIKGYLTDAASRTAVQSQSRSSAAMGYIEEWGDRAVRPRRAYRPDLRRHQRRAGDGPCRSQACPEWRPRRPRLSSSVLGAGHCSGQAEAGDPAGIVEPLEKAVGHLQAATMWLAQNGPANPDECRRRRPTPIWSLMGLVDDRLDVDEDGQDQSAKLKTDADGEDVDVPRSQARSPRNYYGDALAPRSFERDAPKGGSGIAETRHEDAGREPSKASRIVMKESRAGSGPRPALSSYGSAFARRRYRTAWSMDHGRLVEHGVGALALGRRQTADRSKLGRRTGCRSGCACAQRTVPDHGAGADNVQGQHCVPGATGFSGIL